jgi:hypothetical protein
LRFTWIAGTAGEVVGQPVADDGILPDAEVRPTLGHVVTELAEVRDDVELSGNITLFSKNCRKKNIFDFY